MKFFFVFIFCVFALAPVFSQSNVLHNNWNDDFEMFDVENPTVEINYGISRLKHKKFSGKLSDAGVVEIRLGFNKTNEVQKSKFIKNFHDVTIFIKNISTEINNNSNKVNEYKSETWMAGYSNNSGYGYFWGDFAIIPYNGYSFVWNSFNCPDLKPDSMNYLPEKPLSRINKSVRFGTSSEAGIKIQPFKFLTINGAFETNVIFPRYMVWKHAVSLIIEFGSQKAADEFVNEIMKSSPAAAPFISFLLKSGISYGFYKLKQENMNWPFKTEAPLTYETFKVGMTFTF